MFRKVNISVLQKVTEENFNDFGEFPRDSLDIYTLDLYGSGKFFTGFNCVDAGSGRIVVGNGRAYFDGVGYYNDDEGGTTKDLISLAPVTLTRWVAIVVYGREIQTDTVPTEFLTDTATRATVSRVQSQESRRRAEVDIAVGQPSASPSYPPTSSDTIVVAYVLLGPTGLLQLNQNLDGIAPTTVENAQRLDENDSWRANTGVAISALNSNLAAIQSRLLDVPSAFFVRTMAMDLAKLREKAGLPQVYSAYHSNTYITAAQSQIGHVDQLCNIEEGARFPNAAVQDTQIGLLNPYDASVVTMSGNILPTFKADYLQYGFSNFRAADTRNMYSMASSQYQTIEYIQKRGSRTRIRAGTYYEVCSNWLSYYASGATYDALNRILTLTNGEQVQVAPDVSESLVGKIISGSDSHALIRVRSVWIDDGSAEPYPTSFQSENTASGALCGQTFLNTKEGFIANFGFQLASVAPNGDINVMLTECTANGQPDLDNVIGVTKVAQNIPFPDYSVASFSPPVAVKKGKMYAVVLQTVGNHVIYRTSQSQLINGTFFSSNDGRWLVPDQQYDLGMFCSYAIFDKTRIEVALQSLSLNGGMTAIDILAQLLVPDGCSLSFEVQFNGVWTDITTLRDPTVNPLNGLPPLLPFRAVFNGTQFVMPILGVGPNSRVRTKRPGPNMRDISVVYTPPAPVKTISVATRIEAWDANHHTAACKLRTGAGYATITNPTAVSDQAAPEDPRALIRTSVFVLASTVTSYLIDHQLTTDNVVITPHIATRVDVATNP